MEVPKQWQITEAIVIESLGSAANLRTTLNWQTKFFRNELIVNFSTGYGSLGLKSSLEALTREDRSWIVLCHHSYGRAEVVLRTVHLVHIVRKEVAVHYLMGARHRVQWSHVVPQGRGKDQIVLYS